MTHLQELKARRLKLISIQREVNAKLTAVNAAIEEATGVAARHREQAELNHGRTLYAIKETRGMLRSRRNDQRLKQYLAHLMQVKLTKGAEAHIPLSKY